MTGQEANPLQFWQDALAGKKPPIREGAPERGYYSTREGGARQPVQVYAGANGLIAYIGRKGQGAVTSAAAAWTRFAAHPITFETWKAVYNGADWPDEAAPVADASRPAIPEAEQKRLAADAIAITEDWRPKHAPPPAGHNGPPEEDGTIYDPVLSGLGDELDDLAENAAAVLRHGVVGQEDADRAANLTDKVRALKKRIDAAYEVEWRPLDDAVKAVREKFRRPQDRTELIVKKLRDAIARWMTAEEERRKVAAMATIAAGGDAAEAAPAPEPVRAGGAAGKRMSTRKLPDTARVDDWGALFAALVDNSDMREMAQKIANKAAAVGGVFPGTTIIKGGKTAT
jgi:hypothetical protein